MGLTFVTSWPLCVRFYIPGAVGEMLSGITPLRFGKPCSVVSDISIPGPPACVGPGCGLEDFPLASGFIYVYFLDNQMNCKSKLRYFPCFQLNKSSCILPVDYAIYLDTLSILIKGVPIRAQDFIL
jgi:hypothetical protein